MVRHVLLATKRVNLWACKLSHEVMLWVVLAMWILTDLPIRQVLKHARRYPAAELIRGYHERWEHALVFDEQKTHQEPRRNRINPRVIKQKTSKWPKKNAPNTAIRRR